MSDPAAPLLEPGSRARSTVFVALAGGAAFWVLDALEGALVSGRATLTDELLHPAAGEIWTRLLVTALVVMLYRVRLTTRRLHLLSSALAAAPDGIQIAKLDGTIVYSNEAVRAIYGFAPAELLGKHVDSMNAEPTFASRVVLPALRKDGRWEGEIEVWHKQGHTFPIWLTTSVLLDRGRPVGAVGVIRDISDRKRTETELRRYARQLEEATSLKELFADILRHDLLGPAATVQLSLDTLLRRDADADTMRRILETARRSLAKLIVMIEGAATYAKLSAAQQIEFGRLDLGAILKEVVAETELRLPDVRGRIVFEARGEYRVRAHPVIADVFENLVSNAVKYGPPGGTIRIDVRPEGERWRVSVADRGEGISDDDKQKIFMRFERLRKEGVKGTGLGLAIAKRIVDLHGGSIWAEDNPGGGSVFVVSLARAAEPAPTGGAP